MVDLSWHASVVICVTFSYSLGCWLRQSAVLVAAFVLMHRYRACIKVTGCLCDRNLGPRGGGNKSN